MLFVKHPSIILLARAEKSEVAAQKALAIAQAKQASAAKSRELAALAESKERIAELRQIESAAYLRYTQVSDAYAAASLSRDAAKAACETTVKKLKRTEAQLQIATADLDFAKTQVDLAEKECK